MASPFTNVVKAMNPSNSYYDKLEKWTTSPLKTVFITMANITIGPQPTPMGKRLLTTLLIFWLCSSLSLQASFAQDTPSRTLTGHHGEIFALAFSPDGQYLASGGGDQTVRVWERTSGHIRHELKGHTSTIRALAFTPDNRFVASGGSDRTCRIWDISSGKEFISFSIRFGNIRSISFSPDGETLATVGDGGALYLWDWKSGKTLKAMKSGFGIMFSVAYSPDGRILATGNSDNKIHIWDPTSGRQLQALSGHTGAVHTVAFSSDGQLLASGSADKTVRLWDLGTGRERGLLQGHTGAIQSVAFSPDGQQVISAGQDGTIRIWGSKSGQELASFAEHKGPVWALALTAHDHALASGGRDRLVRVRTPKTNTKIVSRKAKEQPAIQERDGETGPPPSPPPYPEARLVLQPHEVKPGHSLKIHLMVKNTGKGPLYRFQATTHSPNPLFDGQLLYFGKIDAGQRKAESLTIPVPEDFSSSETNIQVSFKEFNGFIPDPLQAALTISSAQRPRFAYNYQILDDGSGQIGWEW